MASYEATSPESDEVEVTIQPLPYSAEATTSGNVARVSLGTFRGEGMGYPYPPSQTTMPAPLTQPMQDEGGTETQEAPKLASYPDALYAEQPPEYRADGEGPSERIGDIADEEEGDSRSNLRGIAEPPAQVMTALGPMPLPPEIRSKIPEKFVAKPIVEEREIYVAKKEVQERTIEIPHVHYEHKFCEIPKGFKIKKLVPAVKEVIREIPKEIYKPVVEEKVIEIPQGVKYVEVPVEVPCLYPPKIMPKTKVQLVERVVETIKPIVKEKIIEVPQTVVKQVPKIKTVEVPYYIPRYVEKIVEVPYSPPASGELPPQLTRDLPHSIAGMMPPNFATTTPDGLPAPFTLGPLPLSGINEIKLPYEAKIEVKVTQPEYFRKQPLVGGGSRLTTGSSADRTQVHMMGPGVGGVPSATGLAGSGAMGYQAGFNFPGGEGRAPQAFNPRDRLDATAATINLPHGYKWGAPPNAPPLISGSPFCPAGVCSPIHPDDPYAQIPGSRVGGPASAPSLMVTCPPEVGSVRFIGEQQKPDILTRAGIMHYDDFRRDGNSQILFPPLPPQPGVPMFHETGAPDVRTMERNNRPYTSTDQHPMLREYSKRLEEEFEEQRRVDSSTCNPFCRSDCTQPADNSESDTQ